MTNYPSNITAFLAGIIFCPPHANTADRLVTGPDPKKFNRLFDEATDLLLQKCRDTRTCGCKNAREMVPLPAEALAELMMGLALQMSLIACHLSDCQGWEAGSFEEILNNTELLTPPLQSVFAPDFGFWECLLKHREAGALLAAFEELDERLRIRCVAVLTSGLIPAVEIDRFVAASDKKAYIKSKLLKASSETRPDNITEVCALKQAIAWSIAAATDHPTFGTA